jgi:DNA-binding CsgD family transcriptional regulator
MKTNDERLLALIERAYEAASDAARWPGLLLELSSALECELVALDFQDRDARVARVQHHVGPQDASLQREYEEYYAARNVFLHARPDLTFSGAIRNGEAIVPDRDALKSEYFNDFLRRVGVLHAVGMVPLREGPVMALLSLMRRIGAPSFTDADLALLGRFMPHLQRATSIQRRLREVDLERAAASDALDRLHYGVIVLDDDGRIMIVNAAGEEMLSADDGLRTVGRRLSAVRRDETEELRRSITEACAPPGRLTSKAGGFMCIWRPSGRQPFALTIAPLRITTLELGRRPAAVVFVSDPHSSSSGAHAALRRLYGLTRSEADVADRLLGGKSLDQIAVERGTSISTARTQLKRVLAKTGAHTQAELMRLLAHGPAALRSGSLGPRRT